VFRGVGYLGKRDVSVRTPDVSADRKRKVSSFTLLVITKEYQWIFTLQVIAKECQ